MKVNCDIENLCSRLVKTYNSTILSKADIDFKHACFNEAERCTQERKQKKDTGKIERKVLMQLIENYKINENSEVESRSKKPRVDFIGGPYTLTVQWSQKYKKLIYIFGEHHDDKTDCDFKEEGDTEMLIEDYLSQLLTYTDVFIDLYIEVPGYSGTSYIQGLNLSEDRMSKLYNRFRHCIHKEQRDSNKECNLSRIHYFDIRESEGVKLNMVSKITQNIDTYMIKKLEEEGSLEDSVNFFYMIFNSTEDFFLLLIDLVQITSFDEYMIFWKNEFDSYKFLNEKMDKTEKDKIEQIKLIINEKLISTVSYFYNENNKEAIESAISITAILDTYYIQDLGNKFNFTEITAEHINILLYNIKRLLEELIEINSIIPDAYLLSRIFKKFKVESGKRATDEPDRPRNIIIYAGNGHSDRLRTILEENFEFEMLEWAGRRWPKDTSGFEHEKYNNCINMKSFTQPFFSDNYEEVNWLSKIEKHKVVSSEWTKYKTQEGIDYYAAPGKEARWDKPLDYMSGSDYSKPSKKEGIHKKSKYKKSLDKIKK